ncbi:MAG: hypothetical protein GY811_23605 [Myxococcales bacterium]|nr:hypothetical protein [Myxococcales bacterium]
MSDTKDLFALVDSEGPFAECLAFLAPEPLSPETKALMADYADKSKRPKKPPKPLAQMENPSNDEAIERALYN